MSSEGRTRRTVKARFPNGASARPKVLYVMGAGRSGSTILGVALGNCDDFFYAGELDAWLRRSAVPKFGGAQRERFWAAVRQVFCDQDDLYGEQAWRSLEHSSALLRPRWGRAYRGLRVRYRAVTERLYRQIARESGRRVIIDTSHYPLRANELAAIDGIELCLLYLVRDPGSVVASFRRRDVGQPSKSILSANAVLWLTQLLSLWTYLRHPRQRRIFVRYERLIADPDAVFRQILAKIGSSAEVPDLDALQTGIPFQGNRLLRADTVRLRHESDAKVRTSAVTVVLQLPWLLAFWVLERVSTPLSS